MELRYHPAYTDEEAIARLGPTECGVGCGRLLDASEPWITHDRVPEHVDCHNRAHATQPEDGECSACGHVHGDGPCAGWV